MTRKMIFRSVIIVFALATVGLLWVRKTPQYSLYELGKAYVEHDLVEVEKRLDVDAISSELGDAVGRSVQEEMNKPSTATNEWEIAGEEWGKSLVQSMLPGIIQEAKDAFRNGIVDSVAGKRTDVGKKANFQSLSWKDLLPGGKVEIEKSGKYRLVSFEIDSNNYIFKSSKMDGVWKIVSWVNIDEQLKNFANVKGDVDEMNDVVKNAKYGDRVSLSDEWYVTIANPEEYIPQNEFSHALVGKKYMSVEVLYENVGTQKGGYDPSNFELQDDGDYRYKREYSGRDPMIESGSLAGGEKVRGYLTYEVPSETEVFSVRYSSTLAGTVVFAE